MELLMEPLLTTEEVARLLNTSEASVRRWLRKGEMRGTRVGEEWRVTRADLEEYIRSRVNVPKKELDQDE